jgi:hypothetical protein
VCGNMAIFQNCFSPNAKKKANKEEKNTGLNIKKSSAGCHCREKLVIWEISM